MPEKIDLNSKQYQEIQKVIDKNLELVQELNSIPHTIDETRKIVSEIIGEKIDDSVEIRLPFQTDFGANLHIGKNVYINNGSMFTDMGGIYLDDNVLIGPNVTIASVNHHIEPDQRRNLVLKPVHIGKNAWLGAGVIVTPGVTIGENAVVGAGAVVTKDVEKNTIVAGVPAKQIKKIEE
ncbi:sugar O-acetyltransferase [Companilactobacillus sp.]|jgi:acetyltransferase-like isoleucine patch superfamily enzyme|uniref:sugar O-acetyltransferase n=1 Tax=Companilactobacillus sp. TaxID=2767905 RepID=UPI0025BED104|nr:sugar O-acetyltransferase [Companilactobacillus sp.]MCH4009686.1 sugar O-acetyltransferase [Companilactobacillus sp.]MCH4052638.1 sugar O-acetyltransferase [Companilactobacillus sp.]MCH4077628.1 sugar O-acetyltransferase [Companilactobacillus sp.]MCH4126204.1 sugar O-acetyltransferase [Companilactobacillus sp.]MCI1311912.1 sugar O-acetyltransferase [Companilactobacillus sp.]